jgi:quinol monooxygenase YgiN
MIHVIATITLAPGTRVEFLSHFAWVTPHVRAEDGCLEYQATTDLPTGLAAQPPERPDVVVVVEKWLTVDHLKVHLTAPHMADYRERVKGLVQGVVLQVLQPTAG